MKINGMRWDQGCWPGVVFGGFGLKTLFQEKLWFGTLSDVCTVYQPMAGRFNARFLVKAWHSLSRKIPQMSPGMFWSAIFSRIVFTSVSRLFCRQSLVIHHMIICMYIYAVHIKWTSNGKLMVQGWAVLMTFNVLKDEVKHQCQKDLDPSH